MKGPELEVEGLDASLDEQVFAQFGLNSNSDIMFSHSSGNIPAKFVGKTEDGQSKEMIWGLKKDSRYTPESHPHAHILTIKCGSGIISIGGEEKKYKANDVFDIAPNTPHGFTHVGETTVINQKQLYEQRSED